MSLLFGKHDLLEPLIEVKPNLDVKRRRRQTLPKAIARRRGDGPRRARRELPGSAREALRGAGVRLRLHRLRSGGDAAPQDVHEHGELPRHPDHVRRRILDAVEDVADSFKEARRLGASIALLGVVLFCADPNAHV